MDFAITSPIWQVEKDIATVKAGLRQMPLTTEQIARVLKPRVTVDHAERFMTMLSKVGLCEEYMGRWVAR